MRGARNKTEAIITRLSMRAPAAGTKKWPRALSMPMRMAVRQITSMYGNMMRSNSNIRRVLASKSCKARTSEMPSITSAMTAAATTTIAEITALADRHISRSPSVFSLALKIGMKAAESAPSPSSRRNRLGI